MGSLSLNTEVAKAAKAAKVAKATKATKATKAITAITVSMVLLSCATKQEKNKVLDVGDVEPKFVNQSSKDSSLESRRIKQIEKLKGLMGRYSTGALDSVHLKENIRKFYIENMPFSETLRGLKLLDLKGLCFENLEPVGMCQLVEFYGKIRSSSGVGHDFGYPVKEIVIFRRGKPVSRVNDYSKYRVFHAKSERFVSFL